jgi:hypothetical protein
LRPHGCSVGTCLCFARVENGSGPTGTSYPQFLPGNRRLFRSVELCVFEIVGHLFTDRTRTGVLRNNLDRLKTDPNWFANSVAQRARRFAAGHSGPRRIRARSGHTSPSSSSGDVTTSELISVTDSPNKLSRAGSSRRYPLRLGAAKPARASSASLEWEEFKAVRTACGSHLRVARGDRGRYTGDRHGFSWGTRQTAAINGDLSNRRAPRVDLILPSFAVPATAPSRAMVVNPVQN